MTEHVRSKAWRERLELTVARLAELTGYSIEAIYLFERGIGSGVRKKAHPTPIDAKVWLRWKNVCAGVDAQLRQQRGFRW